MQDNKYRIISNGVSFKVQEYMTVGFWFWKREEWRTWNCFSRSHIGPTIVDKVFSSRLRAQEEIDYQKKIHEWKQVDNE